MFEKNLVIYDEAFSHKPLLMKVGLSDRIRLRIDGYYLAIYKKIGFSVQGAFLIRCKQGHLFLSTSHCVGGGQDSDLCPKCKHDPAEKQEKELPALNKALIRILNRVFKISKENLAPENDPDTLQAKDETDKEWRGKWKKAANAIKRALVAIYGKKPPIIFGDNIPNKLNDEFAGTGIYSILKLVPVGIIILESPSGVITYANDRAIELYGANPLGLEMHNHSTKMMKLLKPNGEIYPPEKLPANRALNGEKIVNDEAIIERPDGTRILVSSTSTPLTDANGEIIGSLAIFENITERRELENRLSTHTQHLEKLVSQQVEQLKNAERLSAIGQTAGMIGHDIRNPLQSIMGEIYLSKLEVDSLPESYAKVSLKESISSVEENLSYINKIVLDLQDYAKTPKPTLEQVAVKKIIQEVLTAMDIPETIQVAFSLEDGSLALKADRTYMKRILTNLISNAIQAMKNGGTISITVKRKEDRALLSVEDTGQGIPIEVRDRIFTPLVTTKPKGQGFGLAVVKKLTEALDGSVTFESELGKGTKFIIDLPL